MRIRKRTPARAAAPGPSPPLSPSPPPPPMQQSPKEEPGEENDDHSEEKQVVLVAEGDGRVVPLPVPAASKNSSATEGVAKPDSAAAADRCSRNDGKRWRCKNSAVPGSPFCARHVEWAARPRQPRANRKQQSKRKKKNGGVFVEPVPAKEEEEEEEEEEEADDKDTDDDGGFYYYGGFQPGERKRAREWAGGSVNQQP